MMLTETYCRLRKEYKEYVHLAIYLRQKQQPSLALFSEKLRPML